MRGRVGRPFEQGGVDRAGAVDRASADVDGDLTAGGAGGVDLAGAGEVAGGEGDIEVAEIDFDAGGIDEQIVCLIQREVTGSN